ncbi:hypothetical protein [Streptomyces sp. NPDC051636]|uniref:hypothetical protein n=1 Tax=Streptomyces sp. NPDC051636 TaxID=3365663 RepID=UPI0037951269
MTWIYLSPAISRWTPKSEGDLAAAISGGLLEESHYLDLKEQTDPGKAGNKELARDLASFAVDGGMLIIGIREDKANRTFHLGGRSPGRRPGGGDRSAPGR